MTNFTFKKLKIPEVILVTPKIFPDERGFFLERYKKSIFHSNGITDEFVQDNHSYSKKNVLRGLHYQINPKPQSKLVTAIKGKIFDVAVDVRKNSPTFSNWVGEELSDKNCNSLYVPEGFAHGFCILSDYADVLYKVNNEYSPEHEKGIKWNDQTIAIDWPIEKPILHEKDNQLPFLKYMNNNFLY